MVASINQAWNEKSECEAVELMDEKKQNMTAIPKCAPVKNKCECNEVHLWRRAGALTNNQLPAKAEVNYVNWLILSILILRQAI